MINFKDKMQYLFNISGLETQKEFTEKVLNNTISTQAFSDYLKSQKNANFQTLQVLIKEIKKFPKFKDLSPAFFFSESNNLTDKNINIAKETGLTDETLENIKQINSNNEYILNDFINSIDKEFWFSLKLIKTINLYKEVCNKVNNLLKDKYFELFEYDLKTLKELCSELNISFELTDFPDLYYGNLIDSTEKLSKLQKVYSYNQSSVINHYIFLIETKSNLEKIIRNKSSFTDSNENNMLYFKNFLNQNILIPLELWNDIKDYANKQIEIDKDKIIKYEVSEYLTLYMNKKIEL